MWERIKRFAADWGSHLTFGDYVVRIVGALLPVGGGGAMSWAAAGSDWFHVWGPIGVISAGILGFVVVALTLATAYALIGFGRKRRAEAAFREFLSTPNQTINPLWSRFTGIKLELAALRIDASSIDFPQNGKIFTDCIISGPGAIAFYNCNIDPYRFPRSNIARYSPDGFCLPDILFRNCAFINCTFLGVTVFFNEADAAIFRERMPDYRFADEAVIAITAAQHSDPQASEEGLADVSKDQPIDTQLPSSTVRRTPPRTLPREAPVAVGLFGMLVSSVR